MATAVRQHRIFIGGEWVDSAGDGIQQVLNPATGETIAEVPKGTAEDVERAVKAARKAFDETWSDTTPGERSQMLLKLAEAIEANAEEFARLESQNVGKPIKQATNEEMPIIASDVRFFAGAARVLEGKSTGEYMKGYTSWIRREPIGVVGSIAPWNYPLWMAIWKIAPALAAGNSVVLKPSEWTPLTALRLAELAAEILPPGVLNVITGDGVPVGAAIVSHGDVDMVSLTGDVSTGKEVARAAADTLKRVHLELGGKAPVLVFDDADLETVVEWVKVGATFNSGQDCTAATRLIAGGKIYEDLLSSLVPAFESVNVGDPSSEDTDMGSLVADEHLERVRGFVDRAREAGATVVTGGEPIDRPGFWYKPSIVADVRQDSEIVQREVFGPVVSVQRFDGDDQAIEWANGVPYGLAASVFTTDLKRALNASRKLKFGTVWINCHILLVSEMPHGGYRGSGYGKDLSTYSLEEYTNIKHVMAAIE
ncbi:MAG: gamma-aminobutyraldehyde dehydrogenase [Actinomycetota bacterium]